MTNHDKKGEQALTKIFDDRMEDILNFHDEWKTPEEIWSALFDSQEISYQSFLKWFEANKGVLNRKYEIEELRQQVKVQEVAIERLDKEISRLQARCESLDKEIQQNK